MDDLTCWLALVRAPGPNRIKLELLQRCHSVSALFQPEHEAIAAIRLPAKLRRHMRFPNFELIAQDRAWLESSACSLVHIGHPAYPPLLAAIDDAPVALFVRGEAAALSMLNVAVVGSRNPTPTGREHAAAFARALGELGLGVVSGLAVGIDAEAHAAALAAGGVTIAVAGNGLDRVYPAVNAGLADAICTRGALISEFPPGTPPRGEHFPRRNRLISGLSLGVLVVEAALKSGSLITARLAADQGREVFAIPGSIDNPLSRGCHRLLRDGAQLVESVDDIVSEIAPMFVSKSVTAAGPASGVKTERTRASADFDSGESLLRALGHDPASMDTLIERTGLTPEEVSSILLTLEMDGYVSSAPGGLYSRATRRP